MTADVSRSIIDTILRINTLAYVVTIIIGVVGNLWVVWKILICIFVICCADLLVLCDLSLLVHFQISKQWMFGDTICKMFYCVEVLNKFLIPVALVHISRSSYRSVSLRPQDNMKKRPHAYMLTANVLAAATVIILMAFVGYFSNTNTYWVREKPMTVCNFNPPPYYETAFNLIAFVVGYIMTSVGYVYFYANVPILLKRRYSTNATIYLMCWTPYWILFWFLSMVHILHRWMVVVSAFTHLLPYIACTAYPVILTAMNKEIRNAHSSIIDSKKRQLTTIRQGALQAMMAQSGMLQAWMRLGAVPKASIVTQTQEFSTVEEGVAQL
ncbi:unnamed protein product [Nippostrongylus brasiliensis]|uniref:G_PROTEIN_RECEP_F1_2 domain-containing protein n=1 Tax=Nippostrongylus brasiliensis TaxID=27835 RepID=A0A158R2A8_NIPBR|nr:unnamed protein product [Nippostrongylus brasiliensis]